MAKPVSSAARTLAIQPIVPPRAIGPAAGHEYCLDGIAEVADRAIRWESLFCSSTRGACPRQRVLVRAATTPRSPWLRALLLSGNRKRSGRPNSRPFFYFLLF